MSFLDSISFGKISVLGNIIKIKNLIKEQVYSVGKAHSWISTPALVPWLLVGEVVPVVKTCWTCPRPCPLAEVGIEGEEEKWTERKKPRKDLSKYPLSPSKPKYLLEMGKGSSMLGAVLLNSTHVLTSTAVDNGPIFLGLQGAFGLCTTAGNRCWA